MFTVSLATQARYTKLQAKTTIINTLVAGSQPEPMRGIRAIVLPLVGLQFTETLVESRNFVRLLPMIAQEER